MLNNISRLIFSAALYSFAFVSFSQNTPLLHTKALAETPTLDEDKSLWFKMEEKGFEELRNTTAPLLSWELQLPGEGLVEITLLESCPFPMFIPIGERVDDGAGGIKVVERDFSTNLITYDLTGPGIGGSMVVFDNYLIGSIRYKNKLFELRPTQLKTTDITSLAIDYVLFDVNDSRGDSHFSCAADDIAQKKVEKIVSQKSMVLECVEIAIDIDKYTYDTFGDCDAAINWSLAILAGVDEIYRTSMNDLVTLQASYVNIWQTTDPYAAYVENAGSMLDALRSTWLNDATLNSSNRDLVHLMTKRGDTGTGGIAWLDVLCDSYGFGFSGYMDNSISFNIPNYNWNLNVVGHEIGHNFGASHTHWCGWPGGPIDNCGSLEGSCDGFTNNPTAQLGTMMSYCHAIGGGSVTLAFHPIVIENALVPGANGASCIGDCAGTITSCGSLYGCTDPTACNYDAVAEVDDGSCGEVDVCGICAGGGETCTGCTDPIACNYMTAAIYDDGSCIYPPVGYDCNCSSDINTVASLTASQSAESSVEATGALNTIDLTLVFTNTSGGSSWAGDLLVELVDPSGQCVSIGGYDVSSTCSAGIAAWPSGWNVTPSGTYTTTVDFATSGLSGTGLWTLRLINGWSGSSSVDYNMTVTLGGVCTGVPDIPGCNDPTACNYEATATLDDGSCDYISCVGCTDLTACNYDSTATLDDGSCDYTSCAGCTYSTACNYDPIATLDDGSCEYESCACPNDLNGDGAITVADILLSLSEFNCVANCWADVNNDGAVTVADILELLAAFGQPC
jgi:hypothetical protein